MGLTSVNHDNGFLHSKKSININKYNLNKISNNITDKFNFKLSYNFPNFKFFLRKTFFNKPDYFPTNLESKVNDFLLDEFSKKIILDTNWDNLRNIKFENYLKWDFFAKKHNLTCAISHNFNNINPWCYPILINSKKELLNWLDWAWTNNIIAYTWPTLPYKINSKSDAYKISKSLVCFSTYFSP